MTGQSRTQKTRARRFERLRHVLWASFITLVLAVPNVLDPLDQVVWVAQSQAVKKEASGEIVFVESRTDLADPNRPERRVELARAIRRLDEAGAAAVYVDVDFELPSTAQADRALNRSLRDFSRRSYLVRSLEQVPGDDLPLMESTPSVSSGVRSVGADVFKNYLGYVWKDRFEIRDRGVTLPTFAASASARTGESGGTFPIDYSISAATIPTLQLHKIISEAFDRESVRNRTVVIGPSSGASRGTVNVPGAMDVSPTIPKIVAAETLLAGGGTFLSKFWLLSAAFVALLAVCRLDGHVRRQTAYTAVIVAILIAIGIGASTAMRTGYTAAIALAVIYGLFRLRARWKESFALIDPETDLPAFAALEADKDVPESVPAIIVARIHKFEQVRRSLPKELHGEYV
ncbi:MAG: CHASE2 domain-containing protein, partial [Alteraurantiacibacter sp.]